LFIDHLDTLSHKSLIIFGQETTLLLAFLKIILLIRLLINQFQPVGPLTTLADHLILVAISRFSKNYFLIKKILPYD
jgi:hypothetical protein